MVLKYVNTYLETLESVKKRERSVLGYRAEEK